MSQDAHSFLHGVAVMPLRKIPDERGAIMHGVRSDTLRNPFGEVYFKKLYAGVINGWHVHETLILNYICILGMIKLVLYDMRIESSSYKQLQEIYMGDDNYVLVHIPPGVANATKGITHPFSLFSNIASEPHSPEIHYLRIDPHSGEIPYDWTHRDY